MACRRHGSSSARTRQTRLSACKHPHDARLQCPATTVQAWQKKLLECYKQIKARQCKPDGDSSRLVMLAKFLVENDTKKYTWIIRHCDK